MLKIINATQAQSNIDNLIDETAQNHEPIFITGNNNQTAVLIAEEAWDEIQNRLDELISDQRLDAIKSGKSEVYTLEEVMKKVNLD